MSSFADGRGPPPPSQTHNSPCKFSPHARTVMISLPGWCLLSHKHAQGILDIPLHFGGLNLWPAFEHMWAPEEVFLPTALAISKNMDGVSRRKLTHSCWDRSAAPLVRWILWQRAHLEDKGQGMPVPEEGEEAARFECPGGDCRSAREGLQRGSGIVNQVGRCPGRTRLWGQEGGD
jgi:hypothetical protein